MNCKIDYISDLYLDKSPNYKDALKASLPEQPNDILVIAGNLAKDMNTVLNALLYYKKNYKHVIYVNGSYELQLTDREREIFDNNSFKKINALKHFINVELFDGIEFLNGFNDQKICIPESGLTFSGLPMFWDYSNLPDTLTHIDVEALYELALPEEYKNISFGKRENIMPSKYFKNNLNRLKKISHCDVMITNYSPLLSNKPFEVFDGKDYILEINPKVWFYGNSQNNSSIFHNGTAMVNACNSYKKIKSIIIDK